MDGAASTTQMQGKVLGQDLAHARNAAIPCYCRILTTQDLEDLVTWGLPFLILAFSNIKNSGKNLSKKLDLGINKRSLTLAQYI